MSTNSSATRRAALRLVRDGERAQPATAFPPAPKLRLDETIGAARDFAASDRATAMIADLMDGYGHDPTRLAIELIEYGFEHGAFWERPNADLWMSRYEAIRSTYGVRGVTA